MGGLFIFISLSSHLYGLNSIRSKTVGQGQHGTARWATKKEIKETYKHIPYEPMAPYVIANVKVAILAGATADKIEKAIKADPGYWVGNPQIIKVADYEAAVKKAHELAVPGDIVALSPASASFDAYPNFVARGRHFKELVNNL